LDQLAVSRKSGSDSRGRRFRNADKWGLASLIQHNNHNEVMEMIITIPETGPDGKRKDFGNAE